MTLMGDDLCLLIEWVVFIPCYSLGLVQFLHRWFLLYPLPPGKLEFGKTGKLDMRKIQSLSHNSLPIKMRIIINNDLQLSKSIVSYRLKRCSSLDWYCFKFSPEKSICFRLITNYFTLPHTYYTKFNIISLKA